VQGGWTLPAERYQIELIPPAQYLRMSYYERWLTAIEQLLVKVGLVSSAEMASGRLIEAGGKTARALSAAEAVAMIAKGSPAAREAGAPGRFRAGQRVRARNPNPVGHTRLPRYARGKLGTIEQDQGVFVFSDADAQGLGEQPQHVYSVRFSARELWGQQDSARDAVYVDLWDDHLDAV